MAEPAAENIIPLFIMPPASRKRFTPPTLEEARLHCAKIGLPEREGEKFMAYFESCGWVVGKSRKPMVSWHGAMATWKLNWEDNGGRAPAQKQAVGYTQLSIYKAEYDDICKRMAAIKGTYSGMMDWAKEDIESFNKLLARKRQLKPILGIET